MWNTYQVDKISQDTLVIILRYLAPMIKPSFPIHVKFTGNEIREIRKFYRMSRAEFGRVFPAEAETIKGWEAGRRNPYGSSGPRLQELKAYADHVTEEKRIALESVMEKAGLKA